jgi:hypothetical protein
VFFLPGKPDFHASSEMLTDFLKDIYTTLPGLNGSVQEGISLSAGKQ